MYSEDIIDFYSISLAKYLELIINSLLLLYYDHIKILLKHPLILLYKNHLFLMNSYVK